MAQRDRGARVSASDATAPGADDRPGGWVFWTGLAIGGAIMAFAVHGIVGDPGATNPPQLARWVLGAAVFHDGLVAPVATAVALLLAWRAPAWWGRPLALAAATSAMLTLFAWPLLRGYGRRALNDSTLPRDYGANLAGVLVAIWTATVAVVALRALRRRRAP
jgi:hypothetical protein